MSERTTAEIIARCRQHEAAAEEELFARYLDRLTRLARARLSPALATRTDPEDVVMSAYRSFFVGVRAGRFSIRRSGELWQLLATITLRKLYHQARRHRTAGRSVDVEEALTENAAFDREPSVEEAVGVSDELASLLGSLDPLPRRVVELRLQDEPLAAIAQITGRSERTIRRTLAEVRELLARRNRNADSERP